MQALATQNARFLHKAATSQQSQCCSLNTDAVLAWVHIWQQLLALHVRALPAQSPDQEEATQNGQSCRHMEQLVVSIQQDQTQHKQCPGAYT